MPKSTFLHPILVSPAPSEAGTTAPAPAAPFKGCSRPFWGAPPTSPGASPTVMLSSIFFHTLYCSEPRYLAVSISIPEATASGSSTVQAILGQDGAGSGWRQGVWGGSFGNFGFLQGFSYQHPAFSPPGLGAGAEQEKVLPPRKVPTPKIPPVPFFPYRGFNASTPRAAMLLHFWVFLPCLRHLWGPPAPCPAGARCPERPQQEGT